MVPQQSQKKHRLASRRRNVGRLTALPLYPVRGGRGVMRFDKQIVMVLQEQVTATDMRRKRAAASLLTLLRAGRVDAAALNGAAVGFDGEMRRCFGELCRRIRLVPEGIS